MKKVYVALGIPFNYHEWCWLLSYLRREKDGLPPREEIKQIKAEALARSIVVVEPVGENDKVARSVPVTPTILKVASSIADRIAQRRSSTMPPVPKFMSKYLFGVTSGSHLERLAIMKSDKVPLPAKVAQKPVPSVAETHSSAEKNDTVRAGSCEKSINFVSREAAEICAFFRPNLLEDMDVCTKFVDGVIWVVGMSSFAKHTTEYRRTALLAMI
ncbi:hypothetical protein ACFX19_027763 [Malus domestica]